MIQQPVPADMQLKVLAPVDELQCDPESRSKWIFYSALDAKTTHELYHALKARHHIRLLNEVVILRLLALVARTGLHLRPHVSQWKTLGHVKLAQVFCCAVLCCAVLCCAVLCCAVLCCAVLCCAVTDCPTLSCAEQIDQHGVRCVHPSPQPA